MATTSNEKPWYQKPQNLTSALIIGVLGYVGYKYGAALFSGILNLTGFLGVAGFLALVIGFVVTQHRLISTVWNVAMYKLTNFIYRIDPIAIAWTRLDSLKKKAEKINNAVERIKGALQNTNAQLEKNTKEINSKKNTIKALSEMPGKDLQVKLVANEVIRLESWNSDLIPLQTTMINMDKGMRKLYEAAQFVIQDKESDLTFLEKKYNSVKVGWAAVKEANDIYGKNSADRKDLEQLIGLADEDMNNKLAEMDRFMELAGPVFMQVDIENSINDSKVQEMINRVTGGEIDQVILNLKTPTPTEPKQVEKATNSKSVEPQKASMSYSSSDDDSYDALK